MDKALEGHIDNVLLVDTCTELLRILPEDVKATFYLKYVNKVFIGKIIKKYIPKKGKVSYEFII